MKGLCLLAVVIGTATLHALDAFGAASAQLDVGRLYDEAIDADLGRSGGLYHHYEFHDETDVPPPEGYRPFYISHYGRHGSRFHRSVRDLNACVVMEAAEKAGVLTESGKALQKRLGALYDAHRGMYECLSALGAEEHRRLALRMRERFPDVFSGGGRVRCKSSTFHRCLLSMANFSCSLKGFEPELDFSFESGARCMETLLPRLREPADSDAKEAARKKTAEVDAVLLRKFVDPSRLMKLLFADDPAVQKLVADPAVFVRDLFIAASTFQTLARELGGVDIYDFFTRDERLALARYLDCHYCLSLGNTEEFGEARLRIARPMLAEIIKLADEAVKGGGVRADLRFGHDTVLLPLACLVGVDGLGARVPSAEAWKSCPLWKYMSMASNIQIVFYRNEAGDCLVKILYNERETVLSGVQTEIGPYYRWSELRTRLVHLAGGE